MKPLTCVNQSQDHIGTANLTPGPLDPNPLHRVNSVAQTCGVDDMDRDALNLDRLAHCIARRTRDVRHDRTIITRQAIEQAGLADVWLPNQHDIHPVAQQGTLPGSVKNLLKLLTDQREPLTRTRTTVVGAPLKQ